VKSKNTAFSTDQTKTEKWNMCQQRHQCKNFGSSRDLLQHRSIFTSSQGLQARISIL